MIAFGLTLVLLGFAGTLPMAMAILLVMGALNAIILITNNILIQTHVSERFRGRVLAIYFMTFSLSPIGVLIGGSLAEVITLQATFMGLGAIVALAGAWTMSRSPKIRDA